MNHNNQTTITKDLANKKIIVTREFDAPIEDVWKAWTERNILDEWWAPKPWKARTKSMEFKPGGRWLYAMVGPNGEEHWVVLDNTTDGAGLRIVIPRLCKDDARLCARMWPIRNRASAGKT